MADPTDRAALETLFATIRASTGWDLASEMLWGYFFVDDNEENLARAGQELQARGYRVVSITDVTDDEDTQAVFCLHVERVERHTIDTLHRRGLELHKLARELGLERYDGVDVAPAPVKAN